MPTFFKHNNLSLATDVLYQYPGGGYPGGDFQEPGGFGGPPGGGRPGGRPGGKLTLDL